MTAGDSLMDLNAISKICAQGLFECPPEDRLLAWLTLSGVLPRVPEKWAAFRTSAIAQYQDFIRVFEIDGYESRMFENTTDVCDFGLPDNRLMELIHGDVIRTHHHVRHFPSADLTIPVDPDPLMPYHMHMRRMERILYVFANCNRTLSYMQGFHEIVAVLYYVSASAVSFFNYDWLALESTVFYTFQKLMGETTLSDLFTTTDHSSLIMVRMKQFMQILERHLPNVAMIVKRHKIHPIQFCYSKLNLVFAQDHELTGLVLLWDGLFAHFNEWVEFEFYIAIALLQMVEELLDPDDYCQTMVVLQKINGCANDPRKLLRVTNRLWQEDHPSN
jgi:hypothetical protein